MKYYCIGIKGAGMSTLACILHDLGNEVIGYDDVKDYKFTQEGLDKRNIKIYYDQNHDIDSQTTVTYSAAFSLEHPEIKRVKELQLNIVKYNDILGMLSQMFNTICVSGTHGKTTTTTIISHILKNTLGTNYFIGDGTGYASKENRLFALESCEFNKHFLAYSPYITIITNIELEHTECYNGIEDIRNTFETFANKSKKAVIAFGDDENIRKLHVNKKIIYYGLNDNNDYIVKNITSSYEGETFDLYYKENKISSFFIPLIGKHMVLNTAAAIIACHEEGVSYEKINELLKNFVNAKNRFHEEIFNDNVLITDYAHHPTEIKMTLLAAREKYKGKKIVAIFKPNTYSRTKDFKDDFIKTFNDYSDETYITQIECNRERSEDYEGINSQMLVSKIHDCNLITNDDASMLKKYKSSVLVFMSCANISHLIDNYKQS